MSVIQERTKIGQRCSSSAYAVTATPPILFRIFCAALFGLLCLACTQAYADSEFLASAETKALGLPFSDAVRINDLLVLSGQLGVEPTTFKLVEGGIEAETRQIFSNMQRILAASNAGFEDIVKCTVMIADIAEWPLFNTLYISYFPGNKPARSAFGANGLALGARVELECWADLAGAAAAE